MHKCNIQSLVFIQPITTATNVKSILRWQCIATVCTRKKHEKGLNKDENGLCKDEEG